MAAAVTVSDLLDGHVALDMQCLDRIYLNGYVPNLQVGGQVVSFMTPHLGYPDPVAGDHGEDRHRVPPTVKEFAEAEHIPVVRFGKDDRKIDVMRPLPGRAGRHRPVRGGRDRGGAGVPERVRRDRRQAPQRRCRGSPSQGRPAGDLLLLLPVG